MLHRIKPGVMFNLITHRKISYTHIPKSYILGGMLSIFSLIRGEERNIFKSSKFCPDLGGGTTPFSEFRPDFGGGHLNFVFFGLYMGEGHNFLS